ncbi:hypothetical protein BKA66DRAFT_33592 [Pyrenochaeta sp. MPI-SDFR-AT-0127]|nr:hypothetical protein BKA66DRAFT_33592 [Pyrenochaeta sp. MPI-SDFR-AT-0127]
MWPTRSRCRVPQHPQAEILAAFPTLLLCQLVQTTTQGPLVKATTGKDDPRESGVSCLRDRTMAKSCFWPRQPGGQAQYSKKLRNNNRTMPCPWADAVHRVVRAADSQPLLAVSRTSCVFGLV